MHPLQLKIITKLMLHPPLRYSEIKPGSVEGNLFTYHLGKLIAEGLIAKRQDGHYELTNIGKMRADRLSLATMTEPLQPKIMTLIICRNSTGEYLFYRRLREPFRGLIGFPHGKVHLGERVAQAAVRELKEKSGVEGELIHRGEAYITVYKDFELASQSLFHIFSVQNPTGKLLRRIKVGESFWAKLTDLDEPIYSPGFRDFIKLTSSPQKMRFFAELVYQL